ncbi:MAG: amidophosphoribosyltransferase [Gemmatimonadota bacterium]|nr:amidophosphoribosyltransferase [Gemmatimonadota bacterium]
MREYCGVFGVSGLPNASDLTYYGLYALQHRGQESVGIVSVRDNRFYTHRGAGLVSDIFNDPRTLRSLKGDVALGHNRYSTTGSSGIQNVQPLTSNFKDGSIAIGHNGNLVNTIQLRNQLIEGGALFQTATDTEVILHLIAKSTYKDPVEKIADALSAVKGAYSIVVLINEELFAARDRHGYRPLSIGRLNQGWVVASETCALDIISAEFVRDVEPGEIVHIRKDGPSSFKPFPQIQYQQCVFELIYFSRPDSLVFGHSVDKVRRFFGRMLAREHPVPGADIVISVPDSSNSAALGFSEESGIPLDLGLIRNHYVGRTFIHPTQSIRDINTRIKYNPVGQVLTGKKVVVVDDSIVRGTTSRRLLGMIRQAGAAEVHMRISSPPIRFPCYYGIDMPTHGELIASKKSIEGVKDFLGVDSLGYLSEEGLFLLTPMESKDYCLACFNGNYAVSFEKGFDKRMHEYIQTSLLEQDDVDK